jgi:hypothetical protein
LAPEIDYGGEYGRDARPDTGELSGQAWMTSQIL